MSNIAFSEVARLENLWKGEFGNEYVDRNINAGEGRKPFWSGIIKEFPVGSILEVGCNVGANLYWISNYLLKKNVYGVDINEKALNLLREKVPGINALWAQARELPFRDRWFDMVFTTGVLIHQTPSALPIIMSEIVRCSRKYILCAEYFAENLTEVPYRKQNGALFKQNFGKMYLDLFPELILLKSGFLPKDDGGWDDVTYWVFEKV